MPALKRIGHKGADLIAPGNTLASFDAALAAGVDMVEFDVLPEHPDRSGRLVLAHDFEAAARREPFTLEQGLAHFAQDAWEGIELDVDLKTTGYERRVVDALREYGLAERALISTMEQESLRVIREAAPEIRLGWSVPKLRRDYLANPVHARAGARRRAVRRARCSPAQAARAIRAGRIDAVMSHWALVTPRLARAVERPAASSTCGRSTTRRGSPSSTRSASPGSSPTTRGCSLPRDLARRPRHAPLTVLAVAVPGGRDHPRAVDDLGAVAPLHVDDAAQDDARARASGGGKVNVVPPCTRRVPMPKRAQPASPPEERTRRHARSLPSNHCRRMRAHCWGAPRSRGIDTRTPTAPGLDGVSQRLTVAHRSACAAVLAAAPAGASARAATARTIRTHLLIDSFIGGDAHGLK